MSKREMWYLGLAVLFILSMAILSLSVSKPKSGQDLVTIEDVQEQMAKMGKTIEKYSITQKNNALTETQKTLDTIDRGIDLLNDQLDENWDRMSQVARRKSRTALRALEKQRNELSEWYGGMRHSSENAWEEVKNGFVKSYEKMADSFEKAAKEFEKES